MYSFSCFFNLLVSSVRVSIFSRRSKFSPIVYIFVWRYRHKVFIFCCTSTVVPLHLREMLRIVQSTQLSLFILEKCYVLYNVHSCPSSSYRNVTYCTMYTVVPLHLTEMLRKHDSTFCSWHKI